MEEFFYISTLSKEFYHFLYRFFSLNRSKLKCMYAFIYNNALIYSNIRKYRKKNYYFTTINKFIITHIDYGRVISI